MNIIDGDAGHQSIAAPKISAPKKTGPKRHRRSGSRRLESAVGPGAGDTLTKEARRLLTALGQPETWAIIDPTDPASVLVHRRRSGISVGAGRFASAVADALVRQDLGRWEQAASGRKTLR